MDIPEIMIGLLFLLAGIALFAGAIVTRLRMEQEIKGGRRIRWNNYLPYWNAEDFSDKGNRLRKIYNLLYFLLIFYSIALIVFMKSGG